MIISDVFYLECISRFSSQSVNANSYFLENKKTLSTKLKKQLQNDKNFVIKNYDTDQLFFQNFYLENQQK